MNFIPDATIDVCDTIAANEIWSADNVYLVMCDIIIPAGVTFTIGSGVTVVRDNMALDFGVLRPLVSWVQA